MSRRVPPDRSPWGPCLPAGSLAHQGRRGAATPQPTRIADGGWRMEPASFCARSRNLARHARVFHTARWWGAGWDGQGKGRPKPPQSHFNATSKPPQSVLIANRLRPQSHPKAPTRLPQGSHKAPTKPGSCVVQARYKPCAWEGIGKCKPGTCEVHARCMRGTCEAQARCRLGEPGEASGAGWAFWFAGRLRLPGIGLSG